MNKKQKLYRWLGSTLLLLIIPIKIIRVINLSDLNKFIIGISPSILGPAGLIFFLQSGTGILSKLSLNQITAIVVIIALTLEFSQLFSWPWNLLKAKYTFDWYDVYSTIISIFIGHVISFMTNNKIFSNRDNKVAL